LGRTAQFCEINSRNYAALHHHFAVDDDGVDVVADAAFNQALDRIADGSLA